MIDRALFTPHGETVDVPIPFGDRQTVPTEEMAYLLRGLLNTTGKVLEIGTGSGYQTAVLAETCEEVVSIEIRQSPEFGTKLPSNVALIVGDGSTYDTGEQFDGILVTFAADKPTASWLRQLKEGCRLVVPIHLSNSAQCRICVFTRRGNSLRFESIAAYAPFTPKIGEA